MSVIYLDNAATTSVLPEAVEAMRQVMLEDFGNPSSLHRLGIAAEKRIESARDTLAQVLSCPPESVYFTSGGTEGNNLLLQGAIRAKRRQGRHVLTSAVEHPAVLETLQVMAEAGEIDLELLPVDGDGVVDPREVQSRLRSDTVLVSVMMVNNETGSIQPIAEIGRLLQGHRCLFHVDGIQAVGKLEVDLSQLSVDLLTLSGHKLHGPKGVGAVFVREGVRIPALQHGGGQERGLRSGTEPVPGIVGMATALQELYPQREEIYRRVRQLKELAWQRLQAAIPDISLNGALERTSPFILNVGFAGVRGEVLLHYLEQDNIFVSTGSACSSRRRVVSHVLEAMGLEESVAEGSIRISFSHQSTEAEVEGLVHSLDKAVRELRALYRR